MKILHTSDWHLGHRLLEQSQFEEQSRFLAWLKDFIEENSIDVLLVSGDIFDTGAPSAQSLKLYYQFLVNLQQTNCKNIIITGGNHDAPGTLNAPKEVLELLSINVIGKATENIVDEVLKITKGDEEIIVAAVPYLRDQDIRKAISGETFDEIGDRYKKALINHYTEIADYCESINKNSVPVLAMGHLFAIGGKTSESEKSIYVGNLGDIKAADFPEEFDYIALGHLHRPQKVDKLENIRYCGSPYILSFSEVGYDKNVVVVTTNGNQVSDVENSKVPCFRDVSRICGTPQECLEQLLIKDKEKHELKPWVEIVLDRDDVSTNSFYELNKIADDLNLSVLKVTIKKEKETAGIEQALASHTEIKDLSPLEIFKLKCEQQGFDLEENPEIVDAFHEILQIAQNS